MFDDNPWRENRGEEEKTFLTIKTFVHITSLPSGRNLIHLSTYLMLFIMSSLEKLHNIKRNIRSENLQAAFLILYFFFYISCSLHFIADAINGALEVAVHAYIYEHWLYEVCILLVSAKEHLKGKHTH